MSADESSRLRSVLIRFHERLHADSEAKRRPSLREYLELFPGFEIEIAEEYLRLRADEHPSVSQRLPRAQEDRTRFGAYRLIEVLGRGGQGVVYKAEDTRLGRLVALKMLAPGYDADAGELHLRFRREAEAASQLDHPGICGVYETGSQDGVPFIAMRFVDGEPLSAKIKVARRARSSGIVPALELGEGVLSDATDDLPTVLLDGSEGEIAEGGVERTFDEAFSTASSDSASLAEPPTRSLADDEAPVLDASEAEEPQAATPRASTRADIFAVVALIERIARALHVAHEAGIVHRDIKPGNVMVQRNGKPVLLDFGLARGESTDVTLTRTGELFGTLPYMAPEQLRDRDAGMDPRTDIYSLGVLAFECLALVRPFDAPTQEALFNAILERDPPSLREANAAVPRDLEVVVETALEKDVGRRYRTALEFAEELRRVREREPIVARPVGPLFRAWRWCERNPALASSVAVILVLLSTWIVRLQADVEREREEAVRRQAEAERATRLFNEGRSLARTFFEGVYDEVLDLPGSTRAREIMVRAALRYLDNLREDAVDAIALQKELLQGYERVAQVQGDAGASNLGDFNGALASLEKARALLAEIRVREPSVVGHALTDVSLALRQVDALRGLGRIAEAEIRAGEAVAAARALRESDDAAPQKDMLAASLAARARTLLDLGRIHEGRGVLDEAESLLSDSNAPHVVFGLIRDQRADIEARLGDSTVAAAMQRKLLERARAEVGVRPRAVSLRRELAQRLLSVATFEEEFDGIEAALESSGEALALIRELVASDAYDQRARRELATALIEHGRRLVVSGDTKQGHQVIAEAMAYAEKIEATDVRNRAFSVKFAVSMSELGEALLRMGQLQEAKTHLSRALERLEQLVPQDGSAGWQALHDLATACRRVGDFHFAIDDMTGARGCYEQGMAILRQITRDVPEDRVRSELATAMDQVADTLIGIDKPEEALARYRESMEVRRALHDENPRNMVFLRNLGISHYNVGRALLMLKNPEGALPHLREALDVDRRLVAADPKNHELISNLGISEYKLGRALTQLRQLEEGRVLLQSAVDRLAALFDADRGNMVHARNLVPSLQALGVTCARLADWEGSESASERLLDVLSMLINVDSDHLWYAQERRICIERMLKISKIRKDPAEERRWRLLLRKADAERAETSPEELAVLARALVSDRTPEELRDPVAALQFARRAVAVSSGKLPAAFDALSIALAAKGDPAGAGRALQRGIDLLPEGDSRGEGWRRRLLELKAASGGR